MQTFADLKLSEIVLSNLEKSNYINPTPIQSEAIPFLLEGRDLLGIAQTGTGKTAAFSLPMIEKLKGRDYSLPALSPRSLILAPTRELATQINEQIVKYSEGYKVKSTVIFGGVGQGKQVEALKKGLDVLVATPGRLLDLKNQGYVKFDKIEIFVLDEADRMLDMGFINDIKKILPLVPQNCQKMLFSATMPHEISKIAQTILKNPKRVEVTPPATTVERINQRLIICKKADKYQLLRKILTEEATELTIVFTHTKHGANRIVDYLAHFQIKSAAIHGNKSQSAREQALADFKAGTIKVLVATDIAARGIDVQGIGHVINYDLPMDAESYVHRIGRTARAGKEGKAISFCDETQNDFLNRIEKLIKMKLPSEKFFGNPEESVKMTKKTKNFQDPRAKNNNPNPNKVGFKYRKK